MRLRDNRVLNPIAWWVPQCRQARRIWRDDVAEAAFEVGFMTFLMALHFLALFFAVVLILSFPLIVIPIVLAVLFVIWAVIKISDPDRE